MALLSRITTLDHLEDLVEEPRIDLRGLVDAIDPEAAPKRRLQLVGTIRGRDGRRGEEGVVVEVIELAFTVVGVEAEATLLQGAGNDVDQAVRKPRLALIPQP